MNNAIDNKIKEISDKYGDGVWEEIFEALYSELAGKSTGKVSFDWVVKHDQINREAFGDYDDLFCFHIRDGNWGGSEVLDCGDISYPTIIKTKYKLVPTKESKANWLNYFKGDEQKADEFIKSWMETHKEKIYELTKNYNYDSHFEPTTKIHNHYKEKANKMGLIWDLEEYEVDVYSL